MYKAILRTGSGSHVHTQYTSDTALLLGKERGQDPSHSGVLAGTLSFLSSNVSVWPHGLRRRSAATRLLRLWVRIPPGASVCCECCVLPGRDICDELISRPDESYRLWCVVVCDLETSKMGLP